VGWRKDVIPGAVANCSEAAPTNRTAFEVFEGVLDEPNDGLATIMADE